MDPDGTSFDSFGSSLAVHGENIAIDAEGDFIGSAYLFATNGSLK